MGGSSRSREPSGLAVGHGWFHADGCNSSPRRYHCLPDGGVEPACSKSLTTSLISFLQEVKDLPEGVQGETGAQIKRSSMIYFTSDWPWDRAQRSRLLDKRLADSSYTQTNSHYSDRDAPEQYTKAQLPSRRAQSDEEHVLSGWQDRCVNPAASWSLSVSGKRFIIHSFLAVSQQQRWTVETDIKRRALQCQTTKARAPRVFTRTQDSCGLNDEASSVPQESLRSIHLSTCPTCGSITINTERMWNGCLLFEWNSIQATRWWKMFLKHVFVPDPNYTASCLTLIK